MEVKINLTKFLFINISKRNNSRQFIIYHFDIKYTGDKIRVMSKFDQMNQVLTYIYNDNNMNTRPTT